MSNESDIPAASDRDGEARIYSAGVLALTDPGPAAAGLVILDGRGHVISSRAYYLGNTGAEQAEMRALLVALRHATQLELAQPCFLVESEMLLNALSGSRPLPPSLDTFAATLDGLVSGLPAFRVERVSAPSNPARAVALAPLTDWLPARTRRAEGLHVERLGEGEYAVQSERQPRVVYRVHLPSPEQMSAGEAMRCECADFQYRGIPCKHLLVVAGQERERLFYPEAAGGEAIPGGAPETAGSDWDARF